MLRTLANNFSTAGDFIVQGLVNMGYKSKDAVYVVCVLFDSFQWWESPERAQYKV